MRVRALANTVVGKANQIGYANTDHTKQATKQKIKQLRGLGVKKVATKILFKRSLGAGGLWANVKIGIPWAGAS